MDLVTTYFRNVTYVSGPLVSIVGQDALSESDRRHLVFADRFERELIHRGTARRTIAETLDKGWELLRILPQAELTRIRKELVDRYYSSLGLRQNHIRDLQPGGFCR